MVSLDQIVEDAKRDFLGAADAAALEDAKAKYLGKSGILTERLKRLVECRLRSARVLAPKLIKSKLK